MLKPGTLVTDLRTRQTGTLCGYTADGRGIVRLESKSYVFPKADQLQQKEKGRRA